MRPEPNENLPDSDQVASEWGNLEDDVSEEPVVDEDDDPFTTLPISNNQTEDSFTIEDIIAQILDFNDPLITTPMEIEDNGIQIVAIYGAFQDGPDPQTDESSDEE